MLELQDDWISKAVCVVLAYEVLSKLHCWYWLKIVLEKQTQLLAVEEVADARDDSWRKTNDDKISKYAV